MNALSEAFGNWTPRAIVFDCDGLLLDTETVWQRAQDTVVAALGADLTAEDDVALHGSTLEVAGEIIARRAGVDEQETLAHLTREFERELGGGVRTMPGAAEVLAAAGAKVPLGCASNSWLEALEHKLTTGGLREHFTVLEASDTVPNPKPAPDMYAAAASAMGFAPGECLAFEDSATGARAARDAGLRLIAVPAPGHPAPPADAALTSLTDPALREWIATW
ncbi:HAD family hydrolase [Brachybacterium aquaticum]|uniref:HAD superfamily hydrolase (TIGR01509 family) n=1 Tax=Brachybacterium aquaticum TaxID=1432564 RepID=A0A841A954_9MICO|nr:HAD family phosphatase [Brachybacterium aquaticum]MBB5830473.1 HAD superfamily hydrolase (TIGR01509 family) [Brachybacterium aquaticum]